MSSAPTCDYAITTLYTGPGGFDAAVEATTAALADNGFGILTTIDIAGTLKKKVGVEMPPYVVLGACAPSFAARAVAAEPLIGTMLPCNVVVRQMEDDAIQVAAVDPLASMQAIKNPGLADIATEVKDLLGKAVAQVGGEG